METGSKGPPLRLETLAAYLDDHLEHETQVLDLLVVAQARGQTNQELWDKLHSAALRDDRLTELAFAYEKLSQDRRVRVMPPQNQAQIFLHAARFFMRAMGDLDGAQAALERVLTLVPGHPDAFDQLRRILEDKGDREKLVALHLAAVGPKTEKEVALEHLRAALALAAESDAATALKVAQQILKLEPSDVAALDAMCASLEAANKFPELARALEQAVAADPPPDAERRLDLRLRLLDIYDDKVPEVERSIPHVEEILAIEPENQLARKLAGRLMNSKAVGARAAAALEKVYESEGDRGGVAQMLGIQIEQLRGPKRAEAQKKLALILYEMGDDAPAFTNFEAVLTADPSDDEARDKYVELARKHGKQADASKVLSRCAGAVKDPEKRARINLESARFLAELGDPKRARVILQGVLEQAEGETALEAARTMRNLVEEPKALAPVLEAIAKQSRDPEEKLEVLRELARMYEGDLKDLAGAIQARKRVLELDPSAEPEELERLLEARGDFATLSEVLEIRTRTMAVDDARRDMLLRAAELRAGQVGDPQGAIALLLRVREEHGISRDVNQLLLPMLEAAGRHAELGEVLSSELALAEDEEKPSLAARLAEAMLAVGQLADAVATLGEVVSIVPTEPTARARLAQLLSEPPDEETRLAVALILAPIQRGEDDAAALVRSLDVIATAHAEPAVRLEALAEAQSLVEAQGKETVRALLLAGRGLREAVEHDVAQVPEWLSRIGAPEKGPARVAVLEALAAPLRDRAIDHPNIARLAQRSAEAYAAAGDLNKAIDTYRRVLEFEPDNEEIIERIDHCLAEKGSPEERIALYRASLQRPGSPERKRGLFLGIARVEAESKEDRGAAAKSLREGLAELPGDRELRDALLEVLEADQKYHELYEELLIDRDSVSGSEGSLLDLRLAQVAVAGGELGAALRHYRDALAEPDLELSAEDLDPIEALALEQVDVPLLVAVAERRVAVAEPGEARAHALEHLGALVGDRGGDPARAAQHLFEAGEEVLGLGDRERAIKDYEKVLSYRPDTKSALERLIGIHAELGALDALLSATQRFVRLAEDRREALDVIGQLGSAAASRVDDVLGLVMLVEERFGEATETAIVRAALLEPAGRVLEAATLLSGRLQGGEGETAAEDEAEISRALAELLARHEGAAELLPVERQLLAHRVKVAPEGAVKERSLELFRFERDRAREPNRAAVVLDELLERDPRDGEVLSERYALALSQEDFAVAASCLSRVMENAEDDDARGTAALEIANLRFTRLGDVGGALDALEPYVAGRAGEAVVQKVALAALARPDLAARAIAILEQVAETVEDAAERAAIYKAMFDHAPPGAMGESEPLLFNAWLACLEDDAARSLEVAALAAVRVPENEAFWDRAEEFAQRAKRPIEVAEAYRKVLAEAKTLDEEVALRIGERGVAFHEEWFDDQELVMKLLRLVVDVAPSATWAFERLKLFYNAGERWPELFELYDRVIAAQTDDEAKSLILEDAAEVSRDLAGDHDRAIGYLEQLLALRRGDSKLEAQLERLYERHGKTESLIRLLDARLPKLSDDDGRAVRLRIASLYESQLSDLSGALATLRPLVEQSDEEATNIALRFIEETEPERSGGGPAYRALTTKSPAVAPVRIQAAQLLAPIYAVLGADEKNARMLAILLESELDPGERLRILRSLAERRAALGQSQPALEATLAELALVESEADESAAVSSAEVMAGADPARLAYLIDALLELGDVSTNKERSLRLLGKASTLARSELKDESRAITADLAILSRSDGDKTAALAAAKKLDRDLRAAKREADRASVLEKLADLEPAAADRRAALVEAANIAENVIGDRQRALRALRRWLADVPNDTAVLTKVVDNLRQLGDSRGLIDALDARAQCATDADEAESDRVEIARLWSRVVGDKAAAVDAYRVAIEKHGSSPDLVDELADLLEDLRREEELAELLAGEATLAEGERKAGLLARLGDTQRRRALWEESLVAFADSLKLAPGSAKAQSGLETLIGALSPHDPATSDVFARGVTALAKSFEQSGQTDRWLALVPARLLATKNELEKCDLLLAAARLEEDAAKNPVRALEKTAQAFGIRAEFPGVAESLLARAKGTGRWDLVAPLLLPALVSREDIPMTIARDLLVLTADWASGELSVPTPVPAEARSMVVGLLAAAHQRAPRDEEVLVKLVAHRRKAPSRELVDNLLALARLRDGDLQLLEEAASAALREVGDDDWGLSISNELFAAAAAILAQGADRAAEEALVWAIDVLEPMLETRRETERVKTLLLSAAALPIDRGRVRAFLFKAAKHCGPEEAVTVYERLYAQDPLDAASAEALAELYAELGRKAELARLYASMADTGEDQDERARLRLLSAELQVELGAADKAVSALRKTLAELAVHAATVALLSKLLEEQKAWPELTALLESQGDLCAKSEPQRAAAAYERAAELADEKLKEVARASRSFKKLVDIAPDADRLDRLATLFERSGQHAEEAAVLERLEEERGGSDELSLRMATAFGRAGQVERARDQLERAVAEGRGSARVREVLAGIYRKAEAWEPLAKLFESEAEAAGEVALKVEKLRDAAAIYAKELGRSEDAAAVLRRAIELKPDDLTTMFSLAEAYRVGDRIDEARDILGRILAEFGTRKPKERALVHYELAKLALSTKDRTTALSELDTASKIDPAHPGVLALLGDVALEEGQYLRAQRTFRALLLVLRSQRGDKVGQAVFKSQVLVELAFIAERQKEADRKTEFVESAFEAAKDDEAEYDALLAALERRGYFDMFARALEKQLDKEDITDAQRTSVELSLADVYGRRLARPADAADLALRCFERELLHGAGPAKAEVESRVIRLLSELGLLERLYQSLHAIAAKLDGVDKVRLLGRAASVAEHDLKDDARTADTLEAILAAWAEGGAADAQERAEILARLDDVTGRMAAAGGSIERHAQALQRVIDTLTDEGATFAALAEPLYRLAAIHEGQGAADAAHALLDRALREDADGDRLEAALREAIQKLPADGRFPRLLEDFGREKGRKRAVIDALELIATGAPDPVALLREAWEIACDLEDSATVERLLRKIVPASADGDTTDLAWALASLAEVRFAASDAREAASLWQRAARMSDPDEERALLLRVADLTDRVLGEADKAVEIYETLRKREPADREVWQPLADLHRRRGDTEALAQLMDETIPLIDDLRERASMRFTLAKMLEVTDPDRAADVLSEAIEEDPQHVEAATLLERLFEATGRDDRLIILLERQLDVAKDAADKARVVALYLRIGELRERLKEEDAALDAYHGALDWDDRNLSALRSAVRLHTQREDSLVLGDLLDKLLENEQGDEAVQLSLKVADMKLASGDPPGAERALLAGFKANSRNAELKQRLTSLYEERGDRVGLARLSAGEARLLGDAKMKRDVLLSAAETIKNEGDAREATDLYAEVVELDPGDRDVLFSFMEVCANTGQHARAISVVDGILASEPNDSWLLFSRAVLREAVGDSDLALDDLEAAFDSSQGQYAAELRAHLEAALVRVSRDPAASRRSEAQIRLRLAEVSAASGDVDAARVVVEELLHKNPQDVLALATMARVEELAGRDEAAATAYARSVGLMTGPELSVTAQRLFDACQRIGQLELARAGLERAVGADPGNAGLRASLRMVYEETGAIAELADLVVEEAHALEDPDARFEKLLEAARLLLYGSGEISTGPAMAERASGVLDEARQLRPDDHDMIQLTGEALAAMGRGDEARSVLATMIASHRGKRSRELGQAYYSLYRVEAKGGNLTSALEALTKAFDNQPQNGGIALELGQLAIDLDEQDVAQRAFRAVTLMKVDGSSGVTPPDRAIAYYHLGSMAVRQGDARRAKLMLEKSLAEDPTLEAARELLSTVG